MGSLPPKNPFKTSGMLVMSSEGLVPMNEVIDVEFTTKEKPEKEEVKELTFETRDSI